MAFRNSLGMSMGLESQLQAAVESHHARDISCITAAILRVTGELFHKGAASEEQHVTNNSAG